MKEKKYGRFRIWGKIRPHVDFDCGWCCVDEDIDNLRKVLKEYDKRMKKYQKVRGDKQHG